MFGSIVLGMEGIMIIMVRRTKTTTTIKDDKNKGKHKDDHEQNHRDIFCAKLTANHSCPASL